jgi:hypothetical protein
MASVLFKTLIAAGILAWMRLEGQYRVLLLLVFLFPSPKDPKNEAPKDLPRKLTAASSEEALRRAVPLGMSLSDARKVLEKKGFKCSTWTDKDGSRWLDGKIWEPHSFLVSRVRKVSLHAKEGRVSRIRFQEYLDGP